MKIGKFHSPYMPNDGHGPCGVPLPEQLHKWLCTLSGATWIVEQVISLIPDLTSDEPLYYTGVDCGDYIGIIATKGVPKMSKITHLWLGIKYDLVEEKTDDRTQTSQ